MLALQTHNVALAAPVTDFAVALSGDGRIASQGRVADVLHHSPQTRDEVEKDESTDETCSHGMFGTLFTYSTCIHMEPGVHCDPPG